MVTSGYEAFPIVATLMVSVQIQNQVRGERRSFADLPFREKFMDIDAQIRDLIDHAPQDGVTSALVAAIAPVLTQIAAQLRHPQYYIVQSLDQNWVVNIISQPDNPALEQQVIYAFPTLKDVSSGPNAIKDPQLMALPVPVTHILFQMVAMEGIDSVIFFEVPGNTLTGTQIRRADLQWLIQAQLQQQTSPSVVPPDIA